MLLLNGNCTGLYVYYLWCHLGRDIFCVQQISCCNAAVEWE